MRSLFLRIFLSFWLAMTLIGAAFAAIYVAYEPGWRFERGKYLTVQALRLFGMTAIERYEIEGSDAVSEMAQELEARTHIRAYGGGLGDAPHPLAGSRDRERTVSPTAWPAGGATIEQRPVFGRAPDARELRGLCDRG